MPVWYKACNKTKQNQHIKCFKHDVVYTNTIENTIPI